MTTCLEHISSDVSVNQSIIQYKLFV